MRTIASLLKRRQGRINPGIQELAQELGSRLLSLRLSSRLSELDAGVFWQPTQPLGDWFRPRAERAVQRAARLSNESI